MPTIAQTDPGCVDMDGLQKLRPGLVFYSTVTETRKHSTVVIGITSEPKGSSKPKNIPEPKDTSEPTFFLGSESIKNLRKYVDAGLILPKSQEEFEAQHLKAPMELILREVGFPRLYGEVASTATTLSLHCREFDEKTLVYISDLSKTIVCFARGSRKRIEVLGGHLDYLTSRKLEFNYETKEVIEDVVFYLGEILELCKKHGEECNVARGQLGEFRRDTLSDKGRLESAMRGLEQAEPKIKDTIKDWKNKPSTEAEQQSTVWLNLPLTGKDELKELRQALVQGLRTWTRTIRSLSSQLGPFASLLAPAHATVDLFLDAMDKMSALFGNMESGIKDVMSQIDKVGKDAGNGNFRVRKSVVRDVKDMVIEWRRVERAARSFQERE